MNAAYIAHIVADTPDGPRGDTTLSPRLAKDFANLMLLCDTHHRLIDREQVAQHPRDVLIRMKATHEGRIELVTGIQPDMRSEVLLYGANVGAHASPVSFAKAICAMIPARYPANEHGILLGMKNSAFTDADDKFWQIEAENLQRLFGEAVRPRLASGGINHLSVFAIAPQPLLMLLGYLLSDIPAAEVFQLHREPPDWCWQDHPAGFEYQVSEPSHYGSTVAVVLALSATITLGRVRDVIGEDASIWTVTIPEPSNDFLKSRRQLQLFRETIRPLLDRIKASHPLASMIHVFPAVPAAIAVEFGRVLMPKADLPLEIYDEDRAKGGFTPSIYLGPQERS
jgi:hypothetical protein